MALFDFLKRKSSVAKAKEDKKEVEKSLSAQTGKKTKGGKAGKVSVTKEIKKEKEAKSAAIPDGEGLARDKKESISSKTTAKQGGFSYNVVKEPHISEKATYLAENNKYVFKIYSNANKLEVKKSVEGIYGVDVLSVNIIKIPVKKRRLGRTEGFRKGYTKAVVTIKEGQKIELY